MKISIEKENLSKVRADALAVFLFAGEKPSGEMQNLDKALAGAIGEAIKLGDFKGKLYEVTSIYTHGKINATRIFLVGKGKKGDFEPRYARNLAGSAARKALSVGAKKIAIHLGDLVDGERAIEGVGLAVFDPALYKTKKEDKSEIDELILVGDVNLQAIKHSQAAVESINWVRKLISEPANVMTPKEMVLEARKLAKEYKFDLEVIDEEEAKKKGMGAFAGIARGSEEPSYLVIFKYNPLRGLRPLRGLQASGIKKKPTLGVVGKGITFDSGGISIKPSEKMHEMKMDMSGAAAVFGFMRLVGELRPKINVLGVTPLTENLPGGKALKPGDVLKAFNGKTIEVLNTDAEGRVVLADGLSYAAKLGATHLVDLATLTGAVVVALGFEASGLMGRPNSWVDDVQNAGEAAGERIWQLPIYPEHKELLRSEIADVANLPPSRAAGTIAGGVFLQEFVPEKIPWAHLDIAGTAYLESEKPFMAKGPTGVGVRTLIKLVEQLEKEK
ncbi:MAG: leucyl aminopeptidase [Candidatus Woykebacteria bacterium]